ncbi:hypothetical protein Hanom_Chr16g01442451 [Helianthus anomalus]
MANIFKELVNEPDGCPFDNNGGDYNMVNDVEEGEIRSSEVLESSPGNVAKTDTFDSSASPSVSEKERSVEHEKPDDCLDMHENIGNTHGDETFPRKSINDNVGPGILAAEKVSGYNRAEERDCNMVDHLDQSGPTPLFGLGKRNRNFRSPPSDGSM